MKIDMKVTQNYAKFTDDESGITMFVDSHDNIEFNVRIGNIEESHDVGSIIALNTVDLQNKLNNIFNTHK
ncbi:hypothetical protein LMH73_011050 [Vibrio splendidus]|nr:hypothetical protein [Vibrio splendidus]MCC4880763.1 hypothetical protein [Vibrio splendidus]